jgi:hypothetical protein
MNRKDNKLYLLIILIAVLVMNVLMYSWQGITYAPDSYRYIRYAEEILTGNWYDPHMIWYIHYAFALIFFKALFGTYSSIVPFQIMLHIISCCYLFLIIRKETGSEKVSLAAVLFYIFWFKMVTWNVFILTDSLFVIFSIITIYFWLRLFRSGKQLIIPFLFLYITFFIRPVGFFLLGALAISTFQFLRKSRFYTVQIKRAVLISGIMVIGLFIRMQSTLGTTDELSKGEVVYNVSTVNDPYNTSGLILDTSHIVANNEKGLRGISKFMLDNPVYFLDMMARKFFFFTFQVRPYYSWYVNLFLLCTLIPLYIAAMRGWWHCSNSSLKIFSATYVLSTIGMAMIITLDWDGRFFLPILPILVILAAIGLSSILILPKNG